MFKDVKAACLKYTFICIPAFLFAISFLPQRSFAQTKYKIELKVVACGNNYWDDNSNGPRYGQNVSYEVRYEGPCGTFIGYGSSGGIISEVRTKARLNHEFAVSANPGSTSFAVLRLPCLEPAPELVKLRGKGKGILEIRVYDLYGNSRRKAQMREADMRTDVSTAGLPRGWYMVHVIREGETVSVNKIWVN